jgi:hypothetical protein
LFFEQIQYKTKTKENHKKRTTKREPQKENHKKRTTKREPQKENHKKRTTKREEPRKQTKKNEWIHRNCGVMGRLSTRKL